MKRTVTPKFRLVYASGPNAGLHAGYTTHPGIRVASRVYEVAERCPTQHHMGERDMFAFYPSDMPYYEDFGYKAPRKHNVTR